MTLGRGITYRVSDCPLRDLSHEIQDVIFDSPYYATTEANRPLRTRIGGGMMLPSVKEDLESILMHMERYMFASRLAKDKIVLDVACGPGYGSNMLLDGGAQCVIGADISDEAISAASQHRIRAGLNFLRLDATRLPFQGESVDLIISFETIEHLEHYRSFLRECRRIMKDSGTFICSTPNRFFRDPGVPVFSQYHEHEFSVFELSALLSQYFGRVQLFGQGRWSPAERLRIEIAFRFKRVIRQAYLQNQQFRDSLQNLAGLFQRMRTFNVPRMRIDQVAFGKNLGNRRRWSLYPLDNTKSLPSTIIAVASGTPSSTTWLQNKTST